MSLLHIRDLSLTIYGAPVLKNVGLEIAPGEIHALTGESGSGKSMTALAVMRLLPKGAQTQGEVRLGGRDLLTLSERGMCALRGNEIGMVFQEPMTALNPVRTIGDQVAETIRIHQNLPRAQAADQAQTWLARVGLPEAQVPPGRYPHEISGGQRQRVVIAMAIAQRPKLLIADEPTTALDVTMQAQILALLRDLVRDYGMGLLMITHDLAVVSTMADRISVMRAGEIVETGPTERVLAQRHHPYTRMLFDASDHAVTLPPHSSAEPLLQVRNVSRDYAQPRARPFAKPQVFRAVNRVSFTLHKGERLGLVGESGCGKSTLTRAILGLEPIQTGSITLNGAPVFAQDRAVLEVRRGMQVVFQDPFGSFNPRHRVGRLVAEPLHLVTPKPGRAERTKAVHKVLSDVGLRTEDADKYIHEFSGGQRQRIAIARALILRPKLVLFDEAVSALDVSVRARILDLLAALCGAYELSYLFISHDLSVVRRVTDRVMVMQAGQIVEEGATEDVFTSPNHPYTQSLIAAAPRLPKLG